MKKRVVLWGVLVGAILLVTPSISHAVLINSVTVDIPGSQFAGPFSLLIWPPPAVNLAPGDQLILTETGLAIGFDFDTSDLSCLPCNPAYTVTVNGTVFAADPGHVLTFNGADDGSLVTNEAADWVSLGTAGGFEVFVGYADTAHSGPFGFDNGLPSVWEGDPGVTFRGGPGGGGCQTVDPCFDAGAIRIVALQQVPAPATLMLIGAALVGVAAWRRKMA